MLSYHPLPTLTVSLVLILTLNCRKKSL